MSFKPGDVVSLSRSGKVFLTQYQSVEGFVSLTRTLGEDVEGDLATLQEALDLAFRESVRRNLEAVNACYEALGTSGDVEALLKYLEGSGVHQAKAAKSGTVKRIRKG